MCKTRTNVLDVFFRFVIIMLGGLMKILKFSKLKSNRYNVTLEDGEVLKLYDDVIVKYSLIRYKEIKDEELDDLIKYNESLDAYYSALKYLTIKLRSEVELKKYFTDLRAEKEYFISQGYKCNEISN